MYNHKFCKIVNAEQVRSLVQQIMMLQINLTVLIYIYIYIFIYVCVCVLIATCLKCSIIPLQK